METLVKRSALVLPTTGYELDREEMSYVDGGIYISNSTIKGFVFAFGAAGANVLGTTAMVLGGQLVSTLAGSVTAFFSWFNALPVVGQIIFTWLAVNAVFVATKMVMAFCQGKGVDISLKWQWFVPYVGADIR